MAGRILDGREVRNASSTDWLFLAFVSTALVARVFRAQGAYSSFAYSVFREASRVSFSVRMPRSAERNKLEAASPVAPDCVACRCAGRSRRCPDGRSSLRDCALPICRQPDASAKAVAYRALAEMNLMPVCASFSCKHRLSESGIARPARCPRRTGGTPAAHPLDKRLPGQHVGRDTWIDRADSERRGSIS